jgi:hypothetical protein
MRFTVDPWDPGYGNGADPQPSSPQQPPDVEVEVPAARWAPRRPPSGVLAPDTVVFVDGVRRLDARAWIAISDTDAVPGIFASYASGAVRCNSRAELEAVEVGRGFFAADLEGLVDVVTRHGTYVACATEEATPEALVYAVHDRMTECEVRIAEQARRRGDELIVLDGPMRRRQHIPDAIGLVKSHYVRYLPDPLNAVVGALAPGERTPVFRVDAQPFSRHSWYLRLPGPPGGPWSGIVRCEATGALAPETVVRLADTVAITLPRFASLAHKDPRAPQNLAPIGGLERILRHRLGDPRLCYRALRAASDTHVVSSA